MTYGLVIYLFAGPLSTPMPLTDAPGRNKTASRR